MNKLLVKCTYGTDVEMYLKGAYVDKNSKKKVTLLEGNTVAIGRELASHERMFKFKFSKHTPEFLFEWEDSDATRTAFATCLKQHPHIKHDENKNISGQTYFSLVDVSAQDDIQFEKESAKVEVYTELMEMDLEGLMEVAFFKLINPSGLKVRALFNKLCGLKEGPNEGVLMKDPKGFLAEYNLKDAKMRITIRKAIVLGLIESQAGNYQIDKRPIGSFDNLIVHLTDNVKYYDYLKKEVEKQAVLPEGHTENVKVKDALSAIPKKERKDTTLSTEQKDTNRVAREQVNREANDRMEIQKAKLKALGVSGWQASGAWSEEKRLEKIAQAEKGKKTTKTEVEQERPDMVPVAEH